MAIAASMGGSRRDRSPSCSSLKARRNRAIHSTAEAVRKYARGSSKLQSLVYRAPVRAAVRKEKYRVRRVRRPERIFSSLSWGGSVKTASGGLALGSAGGWLQRGVRPVVSNYPLDVPAPDCEVRRKEH